jgi:hypothetical protein
MISDCSLAHLAVNPVPSKESSVPAIVIQFMSLIVSQMDVVVKVMKILSPARL